MKSRLRAKIRKWLRKLERRRKLKELYRMYELDRNAYLAEQKQKLKELYRVYESELLTPGETWGALKSWEGARGGAEYVKLDRSAYLEVVQTGYTYIFQTPNILRPEDREEEERRIKKGLAAGVLLTDATAQLIDVKPRLEARVK